MRGRQGLVFLDFCKKPISEVLLLPSLTPAITYNGWCHDRKEHKATMSNKIVTETRFLGMYIFAMSIAIALFAFAYTIIFDMAGTLPITRICNIIIVCASGIGIVYSYLAAEAMPERQLARTYARRDAVIITTMSVYFITASSMFGMLTDTMRRGLATVAVMSLPATVAGTVIIVATIVSMILLTILDGSAAEEIADIEARRRPETIETSIGKGPDVIVTSYDVRSENMASRAVIANGENGDPDDGVQNFIPLSQMGVERIRSPHPLVLSSMDAATKQQHEIDEQRKAASRQRRAERKERAKGWLSGASQRLVELTKGAWAATVASLSEFATIAKAWGTATSEWASQLLSAAALGTNKVIGLAVGFLRDGAKALSEKMASDEATTTDLVSQPTPAGEDDGTWDDGRATGLGTLPDTGGGDGETPLCPKVPATGTASEEDASDDILDYAVPPFLRAYARASRQRDDRD